MRPDALVPPDVGCVAEEYCEGMSLIIYIWDPPLNDFLRLREINGDKQVNNIVILFVLWFEFEALYFIRINGNEFVYTRYWLTYRWLWQIGVRVLILPYFYQHKWSVPYQYFNKILDKEFLLIDNIKLTNVFLN